jgi:hypothetical protein
MDNPWLYIPLGDYEGHMSAPGIAQLEPLADLFEEALAFNRPSSIAILGIAGGNGLDRIDLSVTKHILGVDIQPSYLSAIQKRFSTLPLKLMCVDLRKETLDEPPVSLVHAALIFEHAGTGLCLRNATSMTARGGYLSVVLQLPSKTVAQVSPSPFSSIQALSKSFSFVDQAEIDAELTDAGFMKARETECRVPGDKALWHGIFRKN